MGEGGAGKGRTKISMITLRVIFKPLLQSRWALLRRHMHLSCLRAKLGAEVLYAVRRDRVGALRRLLRSAGDLLAALGCEAGRLPFPLLFRNSAVLKVSSGVSFGFPFS